MAMTPPVYAAGVRFLLDLGTGEPLIACRDAAQSLALARLFVAIETGQPARVLPVPSETTSPAERTTPR